MIRYILSLTVILGLFASCFTDKPTDVPPLYKWTLSFDLNADDASRSPSVQTVADGAYASEPSTEPLRPGYAFAGWYLESGCLSRWNFSSDPVTENRVLYAAWTELPPPSPGQIYSLEFGHSGFPAKDYCNLITLPNDFGNGLLISFWTKITYPIVPPDYRGNQNICRISGDNWGLICLDGNIGQTGDGTVRYNANFMLGYNSGEWGGDICTYYSGASEGLTMDQANDWVWVAWQVVIGPDKSMTLRQWLKFGINGTVFPAGYWNDSDGPGEEILAYGSNALDPICPPIPADWDPGPPRSIQIGDDNTYSGSGYDTYEPLTPPNSYICHARLEARTTKPTIAELDAIARLNRADPTVWGDWELNWTNSGPNLTDRSGHGNNLSVQTGGVLTQGALSPAF